MNNHDCTKKNNNNSNMINSITDTILIHIKLTHTSSLCDMTIRSQSNQITIIINIFGTIMIIYYLPLPVSPVWGDCGDRLHNDPNSSILILRCVI